MPKKVIASWDGSPNHCWVKMIAGKRHRISCRKLGLPREAWTKEASTDKANAYFADVERGLLTVDKAQQAQQDIEKAYLIALHTAKMEQVKAIDKQIEAKKALIDHGDDLTASLLAESSTKAVSKQIERIGKSQGVPAERTIGGQIRLWLSDRQEKARNGSRSIKGADNIRICIGHFARFAGEETPVDAINFDLWESWYNAVEGNKAWSRDYRKKCYGVARMFVSHLWKKEVLESVPRNLKEKDHTFAGEHKQPPIFADSDITRILKNATDEHRLLFLLMLNCGMTQTDIADLKISQVNLTDGTITRRRSKTINQKNTPIVCHKLWKETLKLLRVNIQDKDELALRTKSGKPWVWDEMDANGKRKGSDNVATVFNNLKDKLGMTGADKSLKIFRKTSATKIKINVEFSNLRFYFLGHSERTVSDQSYTGNEQEALHRATDWLRTQYTF